MKRIILFSIFVLTGILAFSQDQFWGVTSAGGQYGKGEIFKTDADGSHLTIVYSFNDAGGGANYPTGTLIKAANGKLYGTTPFGGASDKGTIYEFNPEGNIYTQKFTFSGTDGAGPWAPLMLASNGKLYGVTTLGGTNNVGVIFEFDTETGVFTKKADFQAATTGSQSYGPLMQAANGKCYGMTLMGGASDQGTVFEFDPATGTLTKKKDLSTIGVSSAFGTFCEASNGKLYGVGETGGSANLGGIFEYDITASTLTKVYDFTSASTGDKPEATLIEGSTGKLHGTTIFGGSSSLGTLFEFNLATKTLTKKIDFTGTANGANPNSSLMKAANGKLYGMTYYGGSANKGVLFEYDPATGTLAKKVDFTGTNGQGPDFAYLTEVRDLSGIDNLILNESIQIFPNPFSDNFTLILEISTVQEVDIKLMNVLGKTVHHISEVVSPGVFRKQIETADLPSGIYFLSIRSGKQVQNRRLVHN